MMSEPEIVFDVSAGDFEQRVVAASAERPVVVDFWAEWCAPCRALEPVLERAVRSFEGRALMARLNVDQNPEIARTFGVQSIPAVKVFRDGRVATEFVGALSEPDVRRILATVIPSLADELVSEGDRLVEEQDVEGAVGRYGQALQEDENHPGALLRMGTLRIEQGEIAEASEMLSRIEPDADEHASAQALLARMEFAETCREAGGPEACRRRAEQTGDLDARYGLACCLAAEGDYEAALEAFLAVVSEQKDYRSGAAREAMLHIFSLVGPRSELADRYRRKLAAALY